MPRNGDEARNRLRHAALELFAENGFDQTTAAQIAARAGVTERTFFRHFPDKREVLFDGQDIFGTALARAIGADGVHLGRSDGSLAQAREILGPTAIIGAKGVEQIVEVDLTAAEKKMLAHSISAVQELCKVTKV